MRYIISKLAMATVIAIVTITTTGGMATAHKSTAELFHHCVNGGLEIDVSFTNDHDVPAEVHYSIAAINFSRTKTIPAKIGDKNGVITDRFNSTTVIGVLDFEVTWPDGFKQAGTLSFTGTGICSLGKTSTTVPPLFPPVTTIIGIITDRADRIETKVDVLPESTVANPVVALPDFTG